MAESRMPKQLFDVVAHHLPPDEPVGPKGRVQRSMLRLLRKDGKLEHDTVIVDGILVRAHGGGEKTGPSPVDRRKRGAKYALMVDKAHIVPILVVAENVSGTETVE